MVRIQTDVRGGGRGGGGEVSNPKSLGQCSENILFDQVLNDRAVSD